MDEFVAQFWGPIVNTAVGAMMTWVVTQYRSVRAENSALKEGMQAILRDRIIQTHREYVLRGYITPDEFVGIEKMYAAYHGLGGNGMASRLIEELRHLPHIKEGSEAHV